MMIKRIKNHISSVQENGIYLSLAKTLYRLSFRQPMPTFAGRILCEERLLRYLEKYKYTIIPYEIERVVNELQKEDSSSHSNKVWCYWAQGEDMPEIVKVCVSSQKRMFKKIDGWEYVFLTDENINQYISLPHEIMEKQRKGFITRTHFSDILRLALLERYGGIWIDSTVFLSTTREHALSIVDVISEPLFFIKAPITGMVVRNASNWIIKADAHNAIIVAMYRMLIEYWKNERYVRDYFLFHICLRYIVDSDEYFRSQWDSIPYHDDSNCNYLRICMNEQYVDDKWRQIKDMTGIHKLNWKEPYTTYIDGEKETFYYSLLNGKLL